MAHGKISLRRLAAELEVSHCSLSKAYRAGTWSHGVRLDPAGRLEVTDAAAAIADWRSNHPQRCRMPSMRAAGWEPPPPPDPLDVEVYDRYYDNWLTPRELFAERDELSLLVSALARMALDTAEVGAIRTMVAAQLRQVAALHDATDATIGRAELELASALEMLTAGDE